MSEPTKEIRFGDYDHGFFVLVAKQGGDSGKWAVVPEEPLPAEDWTPGFARAVAAVLVAAAGEAERLNGGERPKVRRYRGRGDLGADAEREGDELRWVGRGGNKWRNNDTIREFENRVATGQLTEITEG